MKEEIVSTNLKAFSCSNPALLSAWQEMENESRERNERINQWEEKTGRKLWVTHNGTSGAKAVGISIIDADADGLPDGWAQLKRNDYLTPSNRGPKAAREKAAQWLRSMDGPNVSSMLKKYGVPQMEFVGFSMLSPGAERHGNEIWVIWSEKAQWDGNEHFIPRKTSEFYAAREASKAEAA